MLVSLIVVVGKSHIPEFPFPYGNAFFVSISILFEILDIFGT